MNQLSTGSRTCVPCPMGTWADISHTKCIPCGSSDCSTCNTISSGLCFNTPLPTVSTQFQFYNEYYISSLYLCQVYSSNSKS